MKKANSARKRACKCPRDENGKFLPKGSVNRFKKRIKKHPNKKNNKRRKKNVFNPSPLEDLAQILNPIKDISELFGPILKAFGGSDITKKTLAKAIKTHPGNVKLIKNSKPMAKRRRNNTNNGKRIDVFPNFMTGTITQPGIDNFTTVLVNTPIPRIQTTRSGQRATVMELLYCEMMFPTIDMKAAPDVLYTMQMVIGTTPVAMIPFNNPRVFVQKRVDTHIITSGGGFTVQPYRYDMETRDGHGYLLAAESFHVSFWSVLSGIINIMEWRLYYRFIDIPLSEFIGLVQSTQQ